MGRAGFGIVQPRHDIRGVGRALLAHGSRRSAAAAAGAADDPRRPERSALLAQRRGANRRAPFGTPCPACCRPTRSGPIPLCMNLDLVVENGSQLGIP